MSLNVDETVVKRIRALREQRKAENLMLRIRIEGGGCSGFRYDLTLCEDTKDTDLVFEHCVITDQISLNLLNGATILFQEDLSGANFKIDNPNAQSGCGCGESFAV
ncbi:MAG: HesB/IscA family protein [Alphaproteobacteria bacterium]